MRKEPTTHVRIPKSEYEAIRDFQQRKGIPIFFEAMKVYYASKSDLDKIRLETKQTIERRIRKQCLEEFKSLFNAEKEQYIREIQILKNENRQLKNSLEQLSNENKSLKTNYDSLKNEFENLKGYHDDVVEELKKYKDSPIEDLLKRIEEKDIEINKLKGLVDELKAKVNEIEKVNRENESLKRENQLLKNENSELRLKYDNLFKNSVNRNNELKFIQKTVNEKIKEIMALNSILDIKPGLEKLERELNKKIDFELEREKEFQAYLGILDML